MNFLRRAFRLLGAIAATGKRPARAQARFVPCLEELETREVPANVELTFINNAGTATGTPTDFYISMFGQQNPGGIKTFTIATDGTATPTAPVNGNAPSIKLSDLTGPTKTILIDSSLNISGGRIYISSVPSAVQVVNGVPQGPNATTAQFYYDFVEFALNSGAANQLVVDTTQVDQVGFPLTLQVDPVDPNFANGAGVFLNRAALITSFQSSVPPAFAHSVFPDGSPPYRLLNPADVLSQSLSATALTVDITPLAGSSPWHAKATITGGPTTGGLAAGMVVSGPFLPAAVTIQSIDSLTEVTLTSTVGPFTSKTGVGLNFYSAPTSALSTYFDSAIDSFFNYYKTHTLTLASVGNVPYTGKTTTVTATDISGGTSTYTVLQFTGNGQTYNIYYPFFTTNTPSGLTPSGTHPPPPPQWWTPNAPPAPTLTYYEPASQMVFACDGVFADNTFQPNVADANVLGNLENQVVTALNRGYATTWVTRTGSIAATSPPGGTATVTLTDGTTAGLHVGMNMSSFGLSSPMTISAITNATTFTVASPQPILPLNPGLLTFADFYPAGGTWNAYAKFLHSDMVTIDGRAYAFAFDDQGGFSTTLTSNWSSTPTTPTKVTITLGPWGLVPAVLHPLGAPHGKGHPKKGHH